MATRVTFQRRHYKAMADVILRARKRPNPNITEAISDIEEDLADLFARDNGRFDRGRFYAACDPIITNGDAQ
jgi:hypothetical protein